jgi:hypothetical protein
VATEVDVIRTVFEAQFTGRQTVQSVIQELGVAQRAADGFSQALSGGGLVSASKDAAAGLSLFQKSLDATVWQKYATGAKRLAAGVQEGRYSFATAQEVLDGYANTLAGAKNISDEMRDALQRQVSTFEEAAPAATGLKKAIAGLSPAMTATLAVTAGLTAGVVALGAALIKLYPIAREGANMAQLQSSFENLNRSVLKTPYLMSDMAAAAGGTITNLAAMEGFLTLTAGASERASQRFAQAAPRLMEIAKAANKLNPTLGDTNFMFNSLARGVKRSEVRLLDNLGLNIKVADANKTYAKEIGKTVMQLTAEDKQMALLNETLRVGANLIDQVGGNLDALPDRFNRATAAWENFTNAWKMNIAANFIPGAEAPVDFFNRQAEMMELRSKLRNAEQQGISVGYSANMNPYSPYSIDDLRKYNRDLEAELARRAEIQERYRRSEEWKQEQRRQKGMQDPYLQWLQQQGEIYKSPDEMAQDRMDRLRRDYESYMSFLNAGYDTGRDNLRETEKQNEATERQIEAAKEMADVHRQMADVVADFWRGTADMQQMALEANQAAMDRYYENIANVGNVMRDLSGDNSLFTTSLENIGTAWVTVGGRTEEQNELLGDLEDAYDRVTDNLRDYQIGIKGYGQDSDKVAKKMGELAGQAEFLKGKMEDLKGVTGDLAQVNVAAVFDMDKVNERLAEQAASAGVGAVGWAALMVAQGKWSEAQAEAAFMQTMGDQAIARAVEKIRLKPNITPEEIASVFSELETELQGYEQQDWSIILHPELLIEPKITFGEVMSDSGYDSSAYIPREEREALAASFFDKARIQAEGEDAGMKARDALLAALIGEDPSENVVDMTVSLSNLEDKEQELQLWMGQERKIFVNIIPVAPNNKASDSSQWNGAGVYSSPPMASGGSVFRGYDYMVGENGPERFVAPADGQIIPNGGSQNGRNNITVNNYGGEAVATQMALLGINQRARNNALLGR